MAQKNKSTLLPTTPLVPQAIAIDPEEMAFAFQVFQAGLRLKMPTRNPETYGINTGDIVVAQGELDSLPTLLRGYFVVRDSRLAPRDIPLHRGFLAVLSHYKDHPHVRSILTRTMAFYFLVNKAIERLEKWQKPSQDEPEAVLLHPAVIEAVALLPTGRYGEFRANQFFDLVEKIAADKYKECHV
jgi:hypothetical protein